jgi:transposase
VAGIDVSKQSLDVQMAEGGEVIGFDRDKRGLAALCRLLRKAGVERVALEASGGYERMPIEALEQAGFAVQLLNPARVRHFAKARGVLAKTDALDAALVRRYAVHFPDAGLRRKTPHERALAQKLGVRALLRDIIDGARNRLEHLDDDASRAIVQDQLDHARGRLAELDKRIADAIAEDDDMRRKARLLDTAKGVGPVLAAHLLALLPELGQVDRKQAAMLAGCAPVDRASGKAVASARIRGGRKGLRPVLHMAALSAMRFNPPIKAFAQRLAANGKPRALVVAACARKLLVVLNSMLRSNSPWNSAMTA